MEKNFAVFFDGTWNEPNDRTNVYELYMEAPETGKQEVKYIPGVGTKGRGLWTAVDRLLGGAFGAGLSTNIREGYEWLSQRHQSGDRIYLFGFSRGAYSARSLAGMIRKCGLLNDASEENVSTAYSFYRDDFPPDSEEARRFRSRFSHETDVHFVGVWDTVGALGVPIKNIPFPGFSKSYEFHDTELSNHVIHAYHAIAANEFREPYFPTFWTRLPRSTPRPNDRPVEQRWFLGAHADVGGGYAGGILQTAPGAWLQEKAASAGLDVGQVLQIPQAYDTEVPHDSYLEFIQKVPVDIKKEAREWDGGKVLGLTLDGRLRARIKSADNILADYPKFKVRLVELGDKPNQG